MSRAAYNEDWGCDNGQWQLIRWRGQVASAIRGKRGQAFLRELLAALDAMPERRLIADALQCPDGVCALGSVGVRRGVDLQSLDPHDYERLSGTFGIAAPLVREIEWENDEGGAWNESPEARWLRLRNWVRAQLPADHGAGSSETRSGSEGTPATDTKQHIPKASQ